MLKTIKKSPEFSHSRRLCAPKGVSIQPAEKVAVWPEIFYWISSDFEALPQHSCGHLMTTFFFSYSGSLSDKRFTFTSNGKSNCFGFSYLNIFCKSFKK